ncbi:hypothetical protein M406DRAFT_343702 [Cryphonectria parasitica EP155]|uniref:Uncharacterized protein n=1 Tax=Cryphonectria parasitica (strain ATCC 38755 / EP155) TaxID=660469 RepID=A0A9P4Y9H9_CRYP1|nr:uncharacterized protein M406DRAFT_343702 [Cryphonectria parasitica EP155]KAF3769449.1 hypothetical protein M406DRAFT_343702 [Cryphonectria parasitica EP155]
MGYEDDLLNIIRTYDVPVDPAALSSALEDEGQRELLFEWVKSHLTPDTLLTKDELNSYQLLKRNGKADDLVAAADLSAVHALNDQEICDAIEELNRSTSAINKQTEALVQQQDALSRLISSSGTAVDARSNLEIKQIHKWESDRQALNTAVELLLQSLDYRVSELEQQNTASRDEVVSIVDSVLHTDDKLLSSLQKLGWELDAEDTEETESVTKLREICARLIKYTVECIRTKLDRVFLESLGSAQKPIQTDEDTAGEDIAAQQEELEELYAEVLPVAQMSVEQQCLEPSLRSLSAKNSNSAGRSSEALEYIIDCLEFLLDRIKRVSARVSTFKEHELVASSVVATAKTELSTPVSSRPSRRGTANSSTSPARRPRSLIMDGIVTPTTPRVTAGGTKTKGFSSGGTAYSSPVDHLLSELAVFLPVSDDPSKSTAQAQASFLSAALAHRARKSAEVSRNVQSAFESSVSSCLSDARTAVQLIRDSVLAESSFAEVYLVDPGIEASIGVLAQEVHKVASRLESVDREAAVLVKGRNVKREEIVNRWGRKAT